MRVLALLLLVAVAHGDVIDDIIAAHKEGKPLKEFAEKDEPDPWIVADDLCARGHPEAALAFAKAAPRKDVEKLPGYVASRRGKATDEAARRAFAAADKALSAKDPKGALAALGGADARAATVVSVRIRRVRGGALWSLRRLEESEQAFASAAKLAERLGWLAGATTAYQEASRSAYFLSNWRGALALVERRLALEKVRGNRPGMARALLIMGTLHARLGAHADALTCQQRSLELSEEIGDRAGAARALQKIGLIHKSLGAYAKALGYQERALKLKQGLGDRAGVAGTLVNIGNLHIRLTAYQKAMAYLERGLRLAESIGHRQWAANALVGMGMIHEKRGALADALGCQERALQLFEALRKRASMAQALEKIGILHEGLRSDGKALAYHEHALKLFEALGKRARIALALGRIGLIHERLGAYPKALAYQQRALKIHEELRDRAGVAGARINIGILHYRLSAYPRALFYLERGLRLAESIGERQWVANALGNIGAIHVALGSWSKALEYEQRALDLQEELNNRTGVARALGNIGGIHVHLGAYAEALEYRQRSLRLSEELDDRVGVAATLGNIGNIHWSLGAHGKALEYQQRALKINEALNNRAGMSATLANIGNIHHRLGALEKALGYQQRVLELDKELGNRAGVARTLANIGSIHKLLGAYAKALEYQQRSLALVKELGNRDGVATALGNIGLIHESLGDYAKALEYQDRARALATELGSLEAEVTSLWSLARIHLAMKNPSKAVEAARHGVKKLPTLVGRLAEEQGARAGAQWAGLMETGVAAGRAMKDPATVFYFLESGRAGALLESLGGREALGGVAIPEELRKEEIDARAAVLAARARHDRALETRDPKEIKTARDALEKARGTVLEVAARIQRVAKAAANVTYPKAAKLDKVQAGLGKDQALVLYALLSEDAVALVVTQNEARFVTLGRTKEIKAALEAAEIRRWRTGAARGERGVGVPDRSNDPFAGLDALRRKLVAPLGLGSDTKRLLVSPAGELAYLPFALLAERFEVVFVPSGTTYDLLLDQAGKRGKGVLALGDPDYEGKRPASAVVVLTRGAGLVRLPGTGVEARAVGDTVLVRELATEPALAEALLKRPRWRAVHLACHGLVDPERPLLCSLALSSDPKNDGFLTALEVFRMKIPADLVVLSACQTGKGKVYRTEGVVGFTGAFLFAGAPRVIVSLWKVDDEATRALMVKFYELWKPGKMATATALKKAQEFVRGQEKWKHPYYWAAWQLWGLPQ